MPWAARIAIVVLAAPCAAVDGLAPGASFTMACAATLGLPLVARGAEVAAAEGHGFGDEILQAHSLSFPRTSTVGTFSRSRETLPCKLLCSLLNAAMRSFNSLTLRFTIS